MLRRLILLALFLTAAIAHAQSLHAPEGGGPGYAICATPELMAAAAHQAADKGRRFSGVSILCEGRSARQFTYSLPPTSQFPISHFLIHYDRTGQDSVPSKDIDRNGIPDYIDSMAYYLENAWHVEIDLYGFAPPPPDNLNPGKGDVDGRIDVYICDLPQQYYGGAQPEFDNPVGQDRVSGYLALDNDYKESSYTTKGIEGVRVTVAHELHHIIQFASYKYDAGQVAFNEMTSVWFERQVEPTILDYLQYIRQFLKTPQDYSLAEQDVNGGITGYAHVLFMDYAAKKHGRNIVREMWEQFETHNTAFEAIDATLRAHGSNLEISYCEFARWCYFTGYRAKDTTYFVEAASYPAMSPSRTEAFAADVIQSSLKPLTFEMVRTIVPKTNANLHDTVDFLVTNARTDFGAGGGTVADEGYTIELQDQNLIEFTPFKLTERTIFYRFKPSTTHFCLDAISGEINVTLATVISPQPFINDGGNWLLISLGNTATVVTKAQVWIYSSNMTLVKELNVTGLEALNNQLGVIWKGTDNNDRLVPSGTYFYQLSINGGEPTLGKIAVIRK
jgi:hypothetical protein